MSKKADVDVNNTVRIHLKLLEMKTIDLSGQNIYHVFLKAQLKKAMKKILKSRHPVKLIL